jgi:branched-chain amino acid transport system substrate-binding protein
MRHIRLLFSLAALIASLASAACGNAGTPAEQRGTRARAATGEIVIGAAWPWKARENLLYAQGMDMAIDEINSAGGIRGRRLRVLKEDDQETVDQGRVTAQTLSANPDVVAVIGHLESYITVPAAAIYDLAGVVLLAPTSTDPALTEQGYKFVFRTTFTDRQVGSHMAGVSLDRGYRRMVIYYMGDRYGRSLANAFEETFKSGGGEVVDRQSYDPNEPANPRRLDSLVDGWKDRQLHAIFIAGEAPQAALVLAAARRKGFAIPVLGGDALGTPELFAAGEETVEGVTLVSPFHADDPRAEVRRYCAAFEKRYGKPPDTAAALAYDTVNVLAEAMKRAPSTAPADLAPALHAISDWRGVTRVFSFEPSGDLRDHPLVTVVARKGKFAFRADGHGASTSVAGAGGGAP